MTVAIAAGLAASGERGARAEPGPPITCTTSGLCSLHGKVQIVKSFAKYKVQIVSSFPDIKVQKVTSFPDGPGKWQFVDSFPDFTIQIVDSFPDIKVQYVDSFPGCD